MAVGADTFNPLAGIMTTATLQQQRLSEYAAQSAALSQKSGLAYGQGMAGQAFSNAVNNPGDSFSDFIFSPS